MLRLIDAFYDRLIARGVTRDACRGRDGDRWQRRPHDQPGHPRRPGVARTAAGARRGADPERAAGAGRAARSGQPVPLRQSCRRAVSRHFRRRAWRSFACATWFPRTTRCSCWSSRSAQSDATVSDHDLTVDSPRLNKRGMTVQGSPLPEEPGAVLLVLQDASAARALDRQLAFRGAARSVTGMAAILAHEVKNPLSGIRGAAQLLETSVDAAGSRTGGADPRRGGPHPRPGRSDGDLRREADRPHRGEHPPGARACAQAGAVRVSRRMSGSTRCMIRRCRRSGATATSLCR